MLDLVRGNLALAECDIDKYVALCRKKMYLLLSYNFRTVRKHTAKKGGVKMDCLVRA